jgi:peptide/nickel transport system substrate-binding protein
MIGIGFVAPAILALFAAIVGVGPASAQKSGGILKISHFDSPASMSVHEEATIAALRPAMAVFNNLVMISRT